MMKPFRLSVSQYRQALVDQYGFADPEMVKRYAIARRDHKRRTYAEFNPFTDDPNCKGCRKTKDQTDQAQKDADQ